MKPRERVEMALNHEIPDRCPMQASFTPEFAVRLREDLKLQKGGAHNPHGGGNTYELERILGEDILLTSVGWANSYYLADHDYTDEWGVSWKIQPYQTPFGSGHYTEIVGHPLADEVTISSYRPPDPTCLELYAESEWMIANFKADYWIVGVTVTTIFETAWALRGLERLMMDMVTNPDLADQILDIPYRYHLTAAKKLVELGVDMIWTGDDVGTQERMLMSPKMWRRYLKPRMATFVAELKALRPGLKIAYHTDGNVWPIIPELVEIGIDVLNPVQPACMIPEQVKRQFGNQLCFWGMVDEQRTLPFGSPGDVQREVIERIKTVGYNGGLILAPTHHVQLDTPLENFWAMVNTIQKTPYSDLQN
jgi:uroporphyrinogen decarboxylase